MSSNNKSLDDYEVTMLVLDGCGHCADAKEKLKDRIASGKIKIGNLSNDESARKLAALHNVKGAPTLILKDKTTNFTEACNISPDGKRAVCKHNKVDL
ncbi:hypothetical protein LCGC14_0223270 [marine sediment metagenome]|uniref:Thioredoxin-like fold domain-containing protein n=1 Tax=marine sediment metagenome TaxID=412755 RepID=A0A0F9UGD2_9ZZZZ|nr:hypothetical protein [bacterium]